MYYLLALLLVFSPCSANEVVTCRDLGMRFDLQMLEEELARVEDAYMPRRPHNSSHWTAIPLRNSTGTHTREGVELINTVKHKKMLPCQDTIFMQELPYIASILDEIRQKFETEVGLVRLSKVPSGKEIPRHRDGNEFDIYDGAIYRLHIPVFTGENVTFELDSNRYHLEAGTLYYTNVAKLHSVQNNGSLDRVHIIIDVHASELLKQHILQSTEILPFTKK